MKNMLKNFFAMIAVFSVFLASGVHSHAAASSLVGDDLVAVEDTIISQALDLDSNSKLSNKTFEAVRLQSDTDEYSIASTIGDKNAIQSIETNGNLTEVTTIIPYKQLSTGELVNSFKYTNNEFKYCKKYWNMNNDNNEKN